MIPNYLFKQINKQFIYWNFGNPTGKDLRNDIILTYTPSLKIYLSMSFNTKKVYVGPSIISADFGSLAKDCQEIVDLGAESLHIDIMDGHFVPNLTIGPPVVKWLRTHLPTAHFDCHLMVTNPIQYIDQLAKTGANCFTFQYESQHGNLDQMCDMIRSHKMEVGLALSPKTPVDETIERLIVEKRVDKVLVMTVEPGFGGQKFMPDMMKKVSYLSQKYPELHIQVDGGINPENSQLVAKSGANWLVAGSAIFCAANRKQAIESIKNSALKGLKNRE